MPRTTPTSEILVTLRITCQDVPPSEAEGNPMIFGLQDKNGKLYPGVTLDNGAVRFHCTVGLLTRRIETPPDFVGDFVDGNRGDRYLVLGYHQVTDPEWIRRWKVSLTGIDRPMCVVALERKDGVIATTISLNADPATPPASQGWTVEDGKN